MFWTPKAKHLSFRGFRVFRGQSLKANSNRTNRS